MMLCKPFPGLASILLLCGAPASAQYSLTTLFASDNAGGLGGAVYFDVHVASTLRITALDSNLGASAGSAVGMKVYLTQGSYVGKETSPQQWSLVANDDGSAIAAGHENPTQIALSAPLGLAAGSYGLALVAVGTSHRYTNGTGANQSYIDRNLTLALGAASNTPFQSSVFTPRVWNGTIHYDLVAGLEPGFTATPRSGSSPLIVTFTDRSLTTDPGGITSWAWELDGDGVVDSTLRNPSFTYGACGYKHVTLTITDATHPPASLTQLDFIEVDPQLKVDADFSASPTSGHTPLTVQFTDQSTGSPTAWAWDLDGDGAIDSTVRNPSFTYYTSNRYDVILTVSNGCYDDTETKVAYINCAGPTANLRSADLLHYEFNEVRGDQVFNYASSNLCPPFGTIAQDGWHGDPGRIGFMGNEPGFGCLGIDDSSPYDNHVDTGWPLDVDGSTTIMWWQRLRNIAPVSGYAFSSGPIGQPRALFSGLNISLLYWGPVPSTRNATDLRLFVDRWVHLAIVIDDAAGTAQWYLDGQPDGTASTFAPGACRFTSASSLLIGIASSPTAVYTRSFEMDDFRVYSRALDAVTILDAMRQEPASLGFLGRGCAGSWGSTPLLAASGVPLSGNSTFGLSLYDAPPYQPGWMVLGYAADAWFGAVQLPFDLGFLFAPSAGCELHTGPDAVIPLRTYPGNPNLQVPLPIPPGIVGHVYAQCILLGPQGAVSDAVDVNIQPD